MKNKLFFLLTFLLALVAPVGSAFAAEPQLTKEQSAKLSESCGTIRQNLKNLQRIDSRTRTYFGAIYETASTKFLKPLNLRLVNNDLADAELLNLQTSIATARTDFSDDFIAYSKSLENLITIDCRLEPENFYKKLLETREKRAAVAADVKTLNNLLTNIVKTTEKLKESLE
ncbi:hypothetical protein IJG96_00415 [Candidatus Saccharibacteria bacterium]|nr:hypothetical protein [Candidatus Saccharibacteria bacterium]